MFNPTLVVAPLVCAFSCAVGITLGYIWFKPKPIPPASPEPKPEPRKPSTVYVTTMLGKCVKAQATTVHYPAAGHLILSNEKDELAAIFAPGNWSYAEVGMQEEKTAAPTPVDPQPEQK